MDEATQGYYSAFASDVANRYEQSGTAVERRLRQAFGDGMRVLDIGAGSGRDMACLQSIGCDVYGLEPSEELRALALELHPGLYGRLESGSLPALGAPFGGEFDGVLCSAVLMHLTRAETLDAALAIRNVLKEDGRLLLSVPLERPGLDDANRDQYGRLFTPLEPDYLQLLFERVGFYVIQRWRSADSLDRPGHTWCTFLMQAQHQGGLRPLDQIEGILNRDRKVATYKLALFRALSEIAVSGFEQVRWVSDGVVGVPIDAVCEKWLEYYWPLFEVASFIPQIRGEAEGCLKPIAFRASLSSLIREYSQAGGLTGFVLDYRSKRLSAAAARLLETVRKQIRQTIVNGPVTYSGGSLETGRVFQYDSQSAEIRMSSGIWRELSLLGHWIRDAIILRWAELTSEISRKQLAPSQIIDLLLATAIPERDVGDARQAYARVGPKECAWTGRPILKSFEVDHIIPFALWRNNDLWNLVPALPDVNGKKSDRLPTRALMFRRRECIVEYWNVLRGAHPIRFDHEAGRITGTSSKLVAWQDPTFAAVADAIEFTAIQRGCERWEP